MDRWDRFDEHRARWEAERAKRLLAARRDDLMAETVAMVLVDAAAWLAWFGLVPGVVPWPVAAATGVWAIGVGRRWREVLRSSSRHAVADGSAPPPEHRPHSSW